MYKHKTVGTEKLRQTLSPEKASCKNFGSKRFGRLEIMTNFENRLYNGNL